MTDVPRQGVPRASGAQIILSFYLENGLFSCEQPRVPHSAVTSLPVSVSSAAPLLARLGSAGDAEREPVSHLIYASLSLPAPNMIIGDMKTTPSPGWLGPAGTDTTSPAGVAVPEDLGRFFRVELHWSLPWELDLLLWRSPVPK